MSQTLRSEAVKAAKRLALRKPRRTRLRRRTLYHVTEADRVPNILKQGLQMGSPKFLGRHLPGIFLSKSAEGAEWVAEWSDWRNPVIIEVRLPKGIEVFLDEVCAVTTPEAEAVYVKQSIPPHCLEVLGEV